MAMNNEQKEEFGKSVLKTKTEYCGNIKGHQGSDQVRDDWLSLISNSTSSLCPALGEL